MPSSRGAESRAPGSRFRGSPAHPPKGCPRQGDDGGGTVAEHGATYLEPAMTATATLEARLDVLALALQCIAASLESAQAREVAAAIKDGLAQILAECGQLSIEQDEAIAMQTGQLLRALAH